MGRHKNEGLSSLLSIRVWARVSQQMKSLLTQRASDEGNSENEIINKALTMYLTKDVMEESLLIAKMSEIVRQIGFLTRKIDTNQKLDLEWYQYFFLFSPQLPKDQRELSLKLEQANKDVQNFLINFRHRVQKMPSFLETIFGDMLEEDIEDKG